MTYGYALIEDLNRVLDRVSELERRANESDQDIDELASRVFPDPSEGSPLEATNAQLRKESARLAERGDSFSLAADKAERELTELRKENEWHKDKWQSASDACTLLRERNERQAQTIQRYKSLGIGSRVRDQEEIESLKEDLARERNKLVRVREFARANRGLRLARRNADDLLEIVDASDPA